MGTFVALLPGILCVCGIIIGAYGHESFTLFCIREYGHKDCSKGLRIVGHIEREKRGEWERETEERTP